MQIAFHTPEETTAKLKARKERLRDTVLDALLNADAAADDDKLTGTQKKAKRDQFLAAHKAWKDASK